MGTVPFGTTVDTTFTVGNTGGAPLQVTAIQGFGGNFEIPTPGPFLIQPGETVQVVIRYSATTGGNNSTFIRVESDDTDEARINFPVTVLASPKFLRLGDEAPAWTLPDMQQNIQTLSAARGKVVVMAFFANW